ncbi:MAG: hypothetical protein WD733_24785, partial [Bryobacterales bacterium]
SRARRGLGMLILCISQVHANSKGFFKLGLLEESQVLLAGASNAGLTDPGHSAAISLVQISTDLVMLQPTLDNIVASYIMLQLVDEIGEAFHQAQKQLEGDALEIEER